MPRAKTNKTELSENTGPAADEVAATTVAKRKRTPYVVRLGMKLGVCMGFFLPGAAHLLAFWAPGDVRGLVRRDWITGNG